MNAREFRTVMAFERNLTVGQPVRVNWTAGSFGHYSGLGTVAKVNRCSVRVALTEPVETERWGGYPVGRQIVVPLMEGSGLERWATFNRVEPVDGYAVQAQA